jgi:multidrug efflux pump subunit AcrA (membrane-fusion protein)
VLQPTTSFCWRGAALGALVALLTPVIPVAAQEVYKSVDADGHVIYTDRGASKNAPKTAVHVKEGDPAEAARIAKEQQLLQAEDAQRAKQQAVDDKNKASADQKKRAACQNARNYYYRLRDSGRIYQRDPDGNRVYYSDSEADTLREQAKRAMTSACGT